MRVIKLVECSDWKTTYGVFLVENYVQAEELQDAIYEVKGRLDDKFEDWSIDEVLGGYEDIKGVYELVDGIVDFIDFYGDDVVEV